MSEVATGSSKASKKNIGLVMAALGVVYGDIGTSPLYSLKECFLHGLPPNEANVLGILSLVLWSLILIVTIKYMVFVMRADWRKEGGILSLLQLVIFSEKEGHSNKKRLYIATLLGVLGATFLYGDGTITPAISVLSAVEGLEVATDFFTPYIVPITVVLLVGLFSIQYKGTSKVGKYFGPVTLVWFFALGICGIYGICSHESLSVLKAFNPMYGLKFLFSGGLDFHQLGYLGSVVLVITGVEALYADMGHFGAKPIRTAWTYIVGPCLALNYLGQGATLLKDPAACQNPFFMTAPSWSIYPMVILATIATIVASQALITGLFSLTMQGMQMGYFPRLLVKHTSRHTHGQIYMPFVNWTLMLACVSLVVFFKKSSNLAAAYSIAVVLMMTITSVLFYEVARKHWRWSLPKAIGICGPLFLVDIFFLIGNLHKIPHGGWFTISIALALFTIMTTWYAGRKLLGTKLAANTLTQDELIGMLSKPSEKIVRVPGTAIFLSASRGRVPAALLHNLKHNQILHERVIFLTIKTEDSAYVGLQERVDVEQIESGFWRVTGHYGYMQPPGIPRVLASCADFGLDVSEQKSTFFIGRETIIPTHSSSMPMWRQRLFAVMARLAQQPARYFEIPPGRVVELGLQVEM